MIARLDKSYYFADSLERKSVNYSFLKKKYQRVLQKKL